MPRTFTEAEKRMSEHLLALWSEAEEAPYDDELVELSKAALTALKLPWVSINREAVQR